MTTALDLLQQTDTEQPKPRRMTALDLLQSGPSDLESAKSYIRSLSPEAIPVIPFRDEIGRAPVPDEIIQSPRPKAAPSFDFQTILDRYRPDIAQFQSILKPQTEAELIQRRIEANNRPITPAPDRMNLGERGVKQYANKTALDLVERNRPSTAMTTGVSYMSDVMKDMEGEEPGWKAVPKLWWSLIKNYYGGGREAKNVAIEEQLKELRPARPYREE